MGQRLNKLTTGGEEELNMKQEIVKDCYKQIEEEIKKPNIVNDSGKKSVFYRAISDAVEKLNKKKNYTQVKAIDVEILQKEYEKYRKDGKPTEDEFKKIMREILEERMQVTGMTGLKDTLLYIFGVPASATLIKGALMPTLVPNEVLIPGLTSLTALVLAKFSKI